jgi:hypothetical protein
MKFMVMFTMVATVNFIWEVRRKMTRSCGTWQTICLVRCHLMLSHSSSSSYRAKCTRLGCRSSSMQGQQHCCLPGLQQQQQEGLSWLTPAGLQQQGQVQAGCRPYHL